MSPRLRRQYHNLLLDAVGYALDNDVKTVRLLAIPTIRSFGINNAHANRRDIYFIAEAWQKNGLATQTDVASGEAAVVLNQPAFDLAKKLRRQERWRRRFQSVTRISWPALAAISSIIAAIAAIASAYFSYLSLAKH